MNKNIIHNTSFTNIILLFVMFQKINLLAIHCKNGGSFQGIDSGVLDWLIGWLLESIQIDYLGQP